MSHLAFMLWLFAFTGLGVVLGWIARGLWIEQQEDKAESAERQ